MSPSIFDLLNIGRYAISNFTMIRDARYYWPIFDFKYRVQKVISVGL